MTGFQGADLRDLQNLAALFHRATGVAKQAASRLDRLTRSDWRISGPAGDDLRNSLLAVCQGLSRCVERVGPLAVDLREQAEEQLRASAGADAARSAAVPVLTPLVFRPDQALAEAPLIQVADRAPSATHRSLYCIEGSCLPGIGEWLTDAEFTSRLPEAVRKFELEVIRNLYGTSDVTDLASLQARSGYHAYMNVTVIPNRVDLDRLWYEYRRSPAPTLTGPHEQPVGTGDYTPDVFWRGAVNPDNPVTPLWPGGVVRHLVDDENRILANITVAAPRDFPVVLPLHGLYPGYVIRWIDQVDGPNGPIYRSWTIGRGTGYMGNTNMYVGSRLFDELDKQIGERARR